MDGKSVQLLFIM